MSDKITIKTNNVPRPVVGWDDLTESERKEFDYLDEDGQANAVFTRYKGQVYDLGEFMTTHGIKPLKEKKWDGYKSDSFFSGIVIRYVPGSDDDVIVGTYFS